MTKFYTDTEATFVPMKRTKPRKNFEEQTSGKKQKNNWKQKRHNEHRQREKAFSEFVEA